MSQAFGHRRVFGVLLSLGVLSAGLSAAPAGPPSYFTSLWQLDTGTQTGAPFIVVHRSNYALVASHNSSPNLAPFLLADPSATLQKMEFAFQLSLKVKLWQDIFGKNVDLWFGYTQRAFWQSYDLRRSAPFRDTDYEPEALFNVRTRFDLLGLKARFVQFGLAHQSNGRSEPLSRTWDRAILGAGLEKGRLSLLLRAWYHFRHDYELRKNPGIDDFMGPGELRAYYFVNRHRFGLMLRDNLYLHGNRGALELEWSFPLLRRVNGYAQVFTGYGESLIDYDYRLTRFGIGFIVRDWD